jgi:hypothetical protein
VGAAVGAVGAAVGAGVGDAVGAAVTQRYAGILGGRLQQSLITTSLWFAERDVESHPKNLTLAMSSL